MKGWKKKLLIGLAIFVVLVTGYVIGFNIYAAKQLDEVVAIADKFQPPANWTLVEETKRSNTLPFGCIPNECPKVYRRYSFKPVSYEDVSSVVKVITGSGLVDVKDIKCEPAGNGYGQVSYCGTNTYAFYGKYRIFINIFGTHTSESETIEGVVVSVKG